MTVLREVLHEARAALTLENLVSAIVIGGALFAGWVWLVNWGVML